MADKKTLEMEQAEWDKKYSRYKRDRETLSLTSSDAEEIKFAEKASFEIEDLLSPENLMDNAQVKILQTKLNQYVHGSDELAVDGRLGPETTKSIRQYQNEKNYWGGHSKVDISPLRTFKMYKMQDHPGHSLKHLSPEQRSARNDSLYRASQKRGGNQGDY